MLTLPDELYPVEMSTNVDIPADDRPQFVTGGAFIFDQDNDLQARWGNGNEALWAHGESLLLCGPTGVGKTTLTVQLLEALVGIGTGTVLGLPVMPAERVLYLAMDRPRQIGRALKRRFTPADRDVLDDRLVIRKGPLPADIAKVPDQFLTLARKADADVVIVDSLKDACVKLTDDESGGQMNRAVQYCNAESIDVLVMHHIRKQGHGTRPTTVNEVYGSSLITNGAGSVVMLWGEPGAHLVDLAQLKMPAEQVGPLSLEHDFDAGRLDVVHQFDLLQFLRNRPDSSLLEAARAEHGDTVKAGSNEYKRTERRLKRLVAKGYAMHDPQTAPGVAARYRAVDVSRGHTIFGSTWTQDVDAP